MDEHDVKQDRILERLRDRAGRQLAMVEHALSCADCKAALLDELAEEGATLEADGGAVWNPLENRSSGLLQMLSEREAQGRDLFRQLQSLPAGEREARIDQILLDLPRRARPLVVLAALHNRSIFRGHEGPEF